MRRNRAQRFVFPQYLAFHISLCVARLRSIQEPSTPATQQPSTPTSRAPASPISSRTYRSDRDPREDGSRNERTSVPFITQPTSSLPGSSKPRDPANTPVTPSRAHHTHRAHGQQFSTDERATASSSSRPAPSLRGNDPVNPRDLFDHPAFKQPIFRSQIPFVPDESLVYQNVRSLHGVVRSSALPVIETTPVPSSGPALDHYLQAMGYDVHAKLAIDRALTYADELVDFVRSIVPQGIPVLEAKYMWALYKSSPPITNSANLHIM